MKNLIVLGALMLSSSVFATIGGDIECLSDSKLSHFKIRVNKSNQVMSMSYRIMAARMKTQTIPNATGKETLHLCGINNRGAINQNFKIENCMNYVDLKEGKMALSFKDTYNVVNDAKKNATVFHLYTEEPIKWGGTFKVNMVEYVNSAGYNIRNDFTNLNCRATEFFKPKVQW